MMRIRNALIEKVFGPAVVLAAFFSGSLVQADLQSSVTYYHNNPGGLPLAATSGTGAVVWTTDYIPYGEKYATSSNTGNNKIWHGGHVMDSPQNIVYMQARYYDPDIGRFLSLDDAGVSAEEPHSFNRYA